MDMRQGRLCVRGILDFELGFLVPSPAVLDQEALNNITKLGSFCVRQSLVCSLTRALLGPKYLSGTN